MTRKRGRRQMIETKEILVAELAASLKMTTSEVGKALKDLGVDVKDINTAALDTETAEMVRDLLSHSRVTEVSSGATLREVAEAIGISSSEAVKKLMALGHLIAPTQRLEHKLAEKLAAECGYNLRYKTAVAAPITAPTHRHRPPAGATQPRPPVVTIMGHVDHGKTSLLDTIRKANVVGGEFGGITQHIGAYQVETEHNGECRKITFLDTPGHAAFTEMRARGAQVTDIVILVVAADDGIMPQTVEAINHAKAAEVPIIVAINKIDKPDARPDRIKQQLTEHNLVVEEYGGDVIAAPVSAKIGEGIPELLEYIALVADMQELKADPHGHARGAIIEARVEPGKGPVATFLVQSGTLRVGDSLVAGFSHGKVRSMSNERGEILLKASPSTPVEVSGLNYAPMAGDTFEVVKNEREARLISEKRVDKKRADRFKSAAPRFTLEDLSTQEGDVKDLNLIVKGDVQGSVEAVLGQLKALGDTKTGDEVRLIIKHSGIGNVSESDISLAMATNSVIIAFNVRADPSGQRAAERDGVDVRSYNIIYDLTADIERAMKGLLAPIFEEDLLGKANILQRFQTPKGIVIAGCMVTEGKLLRGAEARVWRGKEKMFSTRIDTLRRVKDDAREVAQGFECGVVLADWNDVQPDDVIECFEMREISRL